MTEHIVAVFRDAREAEAAERELYQSGVPASAVRRYAGTTQGLAPAAVNELSETGQPSRFWAWLLGEETPSADTRPGYGADADAFDRRAAAGDTVLSVTLADDSQIHRTVELLEAHHPIGIDETTEENETQPALAPSAATTGLAQGQSTARSQTVQGQEEVIPLAKEEVEIGKRQVDRGTTRIRRYVVETPVEREVKLHGERVTVERRSPTSAAGSAPGQFEERVVEVHETDEVPVVQKNAQVAEEVVVRREPTERTETVRDTVRREQVDVTPEAGTKKPE